MSDLINRYLNYLYEYTSYNPDGSRYGMMMQKWSPPEGGALGPSTTISQKFVKKDVEVKIKNEKKGGKKNQNPAKWKSYHES